MRLIEQFTAETEDNDESEKQRLFMQVAQDYENYITRNPDYTLGYIFYGKFLRRLDARKKANQVFMKANNIDPNIALLKQQIGNYLAEEGAFEFALPYFLSAIELSPETALYHFQLGEILYTFKGAYIADKVFTIKTLEKQMLSAFKRAAELEPANRDFQYRYAESFYDIDSPDWKLALGLWGDLEDSATEQAQVDIIRLHQARVFIEMGDDRSARALLNAVDRPVLEQSRRKLLALLN